jgi:flagellar hook-length control protein FliK
MLQALKLDNAASPVKAQAGNRHASDPADTLFAGLMAQTAATASSAPVAVPAPSVQHEARAEAPSSAGSLAFDCQTSPKAQASSSSQRMTSAEATQVSNPAKAAEIPPDSETPPSPEETATQAVASSGVPTGSEVTVTQPTLLDSKSLVAEALPSAAPQPPALLNPVPAAISPLVFQQVAPSLESPPAEAVEGHEPVPPDFRLAGEAPKAPPTGSVQPAVAESSPAAISLRGLKQTSLGPDSSAAADHPGKAATLPDFRQALVGTVPVPLEGVAADPSTPLTLSKTPTMPGAPLPSAAAPTEASAAEIAPALAALVPELGSIPSVGTPSDNPVTFGLSDTAEAAGAIPPMATQTMPRNPAPAKVVRQDSKPTTFNPKAAPEKAIPGDGTTVQELTETSHEAPSNPSKFATIERTSPASTEIQFLKANTEANKPSQVEALKAIDVRSQDGDPEPVRNQSQTEGKDQQPVAAKAREEMALTGLVRASDSAPAQKQHTASAEALTLPLGEGPKPSSTAAHPEATIVRPNPVFAQVEGSIRWILQNKTQGAELQLHPEALGRVLIQLRVEGQEVHARLWASEASSLPVLQEHKAFLEASLKEQGLSLGSFNLHFGTRHEQAQTAPQERGANLSGSLLSSEAKQEIPSRSLNEGLLDSLDPHQIEVYA